MNKKKQIEEISADEVEVVSGPRVHQKVRVTRVSADDPAYAGGNPVEKILGFLDEWKKLRFFGPVALVVSLFSISWEPRTLAPIAIILAVLDLFMGSKITRKISFAAIVLAILSLLNSWT